MHLSKKPCLELAREAKWIWIYKDVIVKGPSSLEMIFG